MLERDLGALEQDLDRLCEGGSAVEQCARHLLDTRGKLLRPSCVLLGARVGDGSAPGVHELAIAVELVHTATLLHDDVVDLGDTRRGSPAARAIYGNATSIFAGDYLLVEALRQIRRAGHTELLDRMLEVIDEMILAESIQLERRNQLRGSLEEYYRVVEGKTASLFRWALYAGARAGGLSDEECTATETFGHHLGVAFQLTDDLLDLAGDEKRTGKTLFADLREGKLTLPILIALTHTPSLAALIEMCANTGDVGEPAARAIREALDTSGAIEATRARAREEIHAALAALEQLPPGPGRRSLTEIAEATLRRER